jgi:hypothetical protein
MCIVCAVVSVGFWSEAVGGDDGLHGVAGFGEGVGMGLQGGLERGTGEVESAQNHMSGYATYQASGIDSCLAPALPTRCSGQMV